MSASVWICMTCRAVVVLQVSAHFHPSLSTCIFVAAEPYACSLQDIVLKIKKVRLFPYLSLSPSPTPSPLPFPSLIHTPLPYLLPPLLPALLFTYFIADQFSFYGVLTLYGVVFSNPNTTFYLCMKLAFCHSCFNCE